MNAASDFYADVVQEYAPGLYKDPMTVPINILLMVNSATDGFGTPSPDSQNYDNKEIQKPKNVNTSDKDRTLPTDNTTLANVNKWDDSKPGGGNTSGLKKLDEKSKTLEECYAKVNEQYL